MVELFIGDKRVDLFESEKLVIKNSVAKIEDITKVFTSISETFSVPASANNNDIFKHFYNANLLNSFDARKLVKGYLYLNGFLYKEGNIKLNKVILKHGKSSSYSIDFFGVLTDLKDIIKDDKLEDLDLSEYDYNKDDTSYIRNNPNTNPEQNVFASYMLTKDYNYNSDGSGGLNLYNGVDLNDISYSIRNIAIIRAIEQKYGLTFSRNFFGTRAFTELFMLMKGNSISLEVLTFPYIATGFGGSDADTSLYQNTFFDSENLPSQNVSFYRFSFVLDNIDNLQEDDIANVTMYSNGLPILSIDCTSGRTTTKDVYQSDYDNFKNVFFTLETSRKISYQSTVKRFFTNLNIDEQLSLSADRFSLNETKTNKTIKQSLPNIKTIDYLKGLFNMFKLVVIPTQKGLLVDDLDSFYKRGKVMDFTNYIDIDTIEVSAGKLLNEIDYKYKESTTILAKKFKELNGREYGELDLEIVDENGNKIEGSKVDFTLPFQQVLYEKITDDNTGDGRIELNTLVTATLLNENLESTDYGCHLHYIHNGGGFYDYNMPSHTLGRNQVETSTTFRNEFSVFNGASINNNLYTNYHKNYIERVFNVRKRLFSYTAKNVPLPILMDIELNDLIKIKNNYFRIDSFDANLKTRDLRLELLLDTVADLSPLVTLRVDSNVVTTDNDLVVSDVLIADTNEDYFIEEEPEVLLYTLYTTLSNSTNFDTGLGVGVFVKLYDVNNTIFEGNVAGTNIIDLSTTTDLVNVDIQEDLDIVSLNLNNRSIQSVNLSYFTDLGVLSLVNNNLTSLSISSNTLLTNLNISSNPLTQSSLLDIVTNLDNFGLSNGVLDISNTTTINTAIQTKIDSLIAKGWTVTT